MRPSAAAGAALARQRRQPACWLPWPAAPPDTDTTLCPTTPVRGDQQVQVVHHSTAQRGPPGERDDKAVCAGWEHVLPVVYVPLPFGCRQELERMLRQGAGDDSRLSSSRRQRCPACSGTRSVGGRAPSGLTFTLVSWHTVPALGHAACRRRLPATERLPPCWHPARAPSGADRGLHGTHKGGQHCYAARAALPDTNARYPLKPGR